MGYKTSKEDFALFKQESVRWLDILGMKSWYVDFSHDMLFDGHEACANVDLNARSANIVLGEEWESAVNDDTIKLAAFHEVCEVFLAPLVGCAYDRFNLSMESIAENTHVIIQTLMNTMYRKY